ncbi:MAG: ribonuclease HII [Rhodobacteraceae bacterium]|jgi:ribonuclease HII|nr:ribonuclease HII [Paracoccaceae bacterium]
MKPTYLPDFAYETAAYGRGFFVVAGVDEVGRGPLAGPVTAAAVILCRDRIPKGLNDSKILTQTRREDLFAEIMEEAEVCVAHATVEEIDAINILRASHLAMERALRGLACQVDHALIDGNMIPPGLFCGAEAIIKGDALCVSISAASIVAKVSRDRIMVDLAQQYPGYGWEHNAGYPTKYHMDALLNLGVTPYHRRSFRPVHNILYQDVSISN